jgi:ribosomal protein S18 acetylase RimI-like enzyme
MIDRALLVQFMQRTYGERLGTGDFAHLAQTVEQYFSAQTPLWWVELDQPVEVLLSGRSRLNPIAVLWMGSAIAQTTGESHAHIFLLYVDPNHRRRGIGAALVRYAEKWARTRGDRQISLQVFQTNQPALNLYQSLGFQSESIWMVKLL